MKKLMLSLLLSTLFLNPIFSGGEVNFIKKADDITYDWLVKYGDETGNTDYVPHFKKIFKKFKVRTCLEFGVGYSTKYFLDSCNKVISVEFVTSGYGPVGIKKFLELYRGYSNWFPIVYFSGYQGDMTWAPFKYLGTESVHKANSYQSATNRNYARIDNFYIKEMDAFIDRLAQVNTIDISLVSGGFYLRGDLVQMLFGKVPVIVAHHTCFRSSSVKDDCYGYSRVTTPEDYEEIYIAAGQGTTVWIVKNEEFKELAEELRKYAKGV